MAARWCALAGALLLGACAVAPPAGPKVLALPPHGKSFAQFQNDDTTCRLFAKQRTMPQSPAQPLNGGGLGHAIAGAGLGAAAGALLGSASGNAGNGAALGAGSGLLLGSVLGARASRASAAELQGRYDISYTQCMVAKGNTVQGVSPAPQVPVYAAPVYGVPVYPSAVMPGPSVSFGAVTSSWEARETGPQWMASRPSKA